MNKINEIQNLIIHPYNFGTRMTAKVYWEKIRFCIVSNLKLMGFSGQERINFLWSDFSK